MELKDKIKLALDEGRILMLGGQVLIGFGYQSMLQPRFDELPSGSQYVLLGSLIFMLVGLACVMSPAARDCLVERGVCTGFFHRFTTRMIGLGLFPFAVGLGTAAYAAARMMMNEFLSMVLGSVLCLLSIFLWYGGPLLFTLEATSSDLEERQDVKLKDKIDHTMTETRMVLPGVQALLGFQFIGMLTTGFERLPAGSKYVHLFCLFLSALTIVLLIAPAAFHRIAEKGEATQRQHRVAIQFLLAAMFTLPPAITGDLFLVVRKVTGSATAAAVVSVATLCFFYGLWFGLGFIFRVRRLHRAKETASLLASPM